MAISFFCCLRSERAHAAPERASRVDYEAPTDCPRIAAFVAEMDSRSPDGRGLSGALSASPLIVVRIEREGSGFHGTLRIPDSSDATVEREVRSASCEEVVQALALIGSVLVVPRAAESKPSGSALPSRDQDSPSQPPAPRSARPSLPASTNAVATTEPRNAIATAGPANSPTTAGPANSPTTAEPQNAVATAGSANAVAIAEPANAEGPAPTRPGPAARGWLWASAGAVLQAGPAPDPIWGPRIMLAADWIFGATGQGLGLRLSAARASSDRFRGAVGDATFTWFSVAAEGCGLLPLTRGIRATPCIRLEIGNLSGAGSRATHYVTSNALWAAVGGAFRAEADLSRFVLVYLDGSMAIAPSRARFYFERRGSGPGLADHDIIHEVPILALAASAGIGMRFW